MGLYLATVLHHLFVSYTVLIFLRIMSSWFPAWQSHKLVRFVAFYTDPYLNVFRRILPPIGGVLDLSPLLAFLGLKIMEIFFIGILR